MTTLRRSEYTSAWLRSEQDLLSHARHLPRKPQFHWWMYRGTARPWPLQTSLERTLLGGGKGLVNAGHFEQQLLKEFKRRAHFYVRELPREGDLLGWLALMQHYGAPTRLLDFTYSFYVAAFFALADATSFPKKERRNAVVWAIYRDDFKLQKQAPLAHSAYRAGTKRRTEEEDLIRPDADTLYDGINEYLKRVIQHPERSVWSINAFRLNERLSVQQGVFLCPGDVTLPFEANLRAGDLGKHSVVCFRLSTAPKARTEMLSALHRMNINYGSLFPGLDGFAQSLKQTPWVPFRLRPRRPSHE